MIDDGVKIADALAKLISSFAWPVVAIYVVYKFGSAIKSFISEVTDTSLKVAGNEFTAKRQLATAVATAEIARAAPTELQSSDASFWKDALSESFKAAEALAKSIPIDETAGKTLLWVDDQTANDAPERAALAGLQIKLETALGDSEAIRRLAETPYDVVVLDIPKAEGFEAGLDLISRLKETRPETPVIIYGANITPTESTQQSGAAFANTVSDLVEMVAKTVRRKPKSQSYFSHFVRAVKTYRDMKSAA